MVGTGGVVSCVLCPLIHRGIAACEAMEGGGGAPPPVADGDATASAPPDIEDPGRARPLQVPVPPVVPRSGRRLFDVAEFERADFEPSEFMREMKQTHASALCVDELKEQLQEHVDGLKARMCDRSIDRRRSRSLVSWSLSRSIARSCGRGVAPRGGRTRLNGVSVARRIEPTHTSRRLVARWLSRLAATAAATERRAVTAVGLLLLAAGAPLALRWRSAARAAGRRARDAPQVRADQRRLCGVHRARGRAARRRRARAGSALPRLRRARQNHRARGGDARRARASRAAVRALGGRARPAARARALRALH